MDLIIIENIERKRFETTVEDKVAFVEYIRAENKMYLTHTEVPSELGGKGIASKMVGKVLEIIKEEDRKLVPLCPFVASYLKKHPEWQEMLANGYSV